MQNLWWDLHCLDQCPGDGLRICLSSRVPVALMMVCSAVPVPLLRAEGRLLNQALTSEHHTGLTCLCLYPCASAAKSCCRSLGPAHGHSSKCVMAGCCRGRSPQVSVPSQQGRMLHRDDELPLWVVTPAEGLTICQPNKPKLSIQTSHL